MLTKMQKNAFVIVAGILAMLVWGPHPALTAQDGAGIWTYNAEWTIALVNLTDYDLTYVRSGSYPVPTCSPQTPDQEMLDAGTDWHVDPFRTRVWTGQTCYMSPTGWDGTMTLYSTGFPEWKFDLVFVRQNGHNTVGYSGTWTALSPHGTQSWAPANTWSTGRWATPVDDYKMHNVMTLISPKIMVALYAADNVHLTLVVQQLYGENAAGDALWDDTGTYEGNRLDFVDNGSSTVPGQ